MTTILAIYPTAILARSGCRRKDFNNLFLLSNYSLFNSLYSIKILCKINRLVGLFCKDKPFPRIMKKKQVPASKVLSFISLKDNGMN
ncbi:hypothetical protein F2Z85_06845 [Bacteroides fragilis]|uniref:Uncharacterized protein n=5 Tax=Bacteroidaceae TaxID=815 RepID=A0A6I1BGZ3_PHOVU|nr:hypothetical protein F3D37_25265 [Bacteroides ovatus]KAA4788077.1 hypothetical protein F3B20_07750 [Bacteroides fragilis]KAB3549324.1 hypothetical protein GAY14_21200 [Phocaeicola vulgatus]KAB4229816.1 hypothetical protein GAP47_19845 [Bacteroides uniformis]KAB6368832.1 hypothetical protein GAZ38_14740 [Bacteroides xylanisolvens]